MYKNVLNLARFLALALSLWMTVPAAADEVDSAQLIEELRIQIQLLQKRVEGLEAQINGTAAAVREADAEGALPESRIVRAVDRSAPPMTAVEGTGLAPANGSYPETAEPPPQEPASQDLSWLEEEEPVYHHDVDIFTEHDPTYGSSTSFLEWHGYLAFEFDDEEGTNSNFDNHEFYLSARASVSEKLSFLMEMEFEHTPEKLILPIQAFGRYHLAKNHTLRAGLFFVPIGLPRAYTLRGDTNLLIRQVALTHDLMFENWSVVGVGGYGNLATFGKGSSITYDVALSNGLHGMAPGDSWFDAIDSLADHTEDNNNNKLVSGRLGWADRDILGGQMSFGASYATQRYSADDEEKREMTHFGVDFRYMGTNGWWAQAEWLERSGDDNPADVAEGVGADAFGWYVRLAKRWSPRKPFFNYFDVVAQVDEIDVFKEMDTNRDQRTVTLGLNYSPKPFFILKAEYDWVEELYGESLDNDKLWLSVVFEF